MKANTVSPRTPILRQLEAAMHLLSECEDGQVTAIALETAAFLVGWGLTPLSDPAGVKEMFTTLSTIENHIVRAVDRAKACDPPLPDLKQATEEYRSELERAEALRRDMQALESERGHLRLEMESFPQREREMAEEIAVMERQLTLLKDHLSGCEEKAESLTQLHRTTASSFDAISGHLGEQDFPVLARTLDTDVMREYRTLSSEAERQLERLNTLLAACSRAVQSDQSTLENKLEKRGKAS